METIMGKYQKLFVAMRYWLLGAAQMDPAYRITLDALEFAANYHCGLRKDGVTPEFQHQLEIAHYLRTLLHWMEFPAETLAAVFLHDICEDYGIGYDEIEKRFGQRVRAAVEAMTKKHRGMVKHPKSFFADIGDDAIASLGKGGDRIHNLQTMVGVFSREKQLAYVAEVKEHFLPMLKRARRQFPRQEGAYENIKHVLTSQVALIEAIHLGS